MAFFKLNGIEVKTPSKLDTGIQDISKAERNALGNMLIDRIATKRKLELQWKTLNGKELKLILSILNNVFFTAEYLDPETNSFEKRTFYAGDRKAPLTYFINGVANYRDFGVNIIER